MVLSNECFHVVFVHKVYLIIIYITIIIIYLFAVNVNGIFVVYDPAV